MSHESSSADVNIVTSGDYFSEFAKNGSDFQVVGTYENTDNDLTKFTIAPGPTEELYVARLIVHVEDTGNFASNIYGSGSALTNGIDIHVTRGGVLTKDLTSGQNIKTNGDWGRYCYDAAIETHNTGPEILRVRWTFSKAGVPIILEGSKSDQIEIIVSDDFDFLLDHTFIFQGRKVRS